MLPVQLFHENVYVPATWLFAIWNRALSLPFAGVVRVGVIAVTVKVAVGGAGAATVTVIDWVAV